MHLDLPIRNVNRTVGTMLGHELTKRHGAAGLPDDTIVIDFEGSAGNSFGAFVPRGITLASARRRQRLRRQGALGWSHRGRRPPENSHADLVAEDNIIAGNVICYGATGGEIFLRGVVGERFCVRNSGVTAVVEGVGDHGCEYMTGGRVVVLGATGRNFGAGMSGGIAYVLDRRRCVPDAGQLRDGRSLEELDDADQAIPARDAVEAHLTRDGLGSRSRRLLGRLGHHARGRFAKVMPNDYRRVLEATARAEREGLDVTETIMARPRAARKR